MSGGRARSIEVGDGIFAVDTEYVRTQADASHLLIEDGRAAFVDTGTNDSVPLLLDALQQADLDAGDVDYVFLTHIHLDHAGGAGALLEALPNATCVVHPRGAPHMIDPARLMAGTIAVYGEDETARLYGELVPIDASRVHVAADGEVVALEGREFELFFVEGHARHHFAMHDRKTNGVFSGDSFGLSYREFDTDRGAFIFPTTTPAAFDPDEAHQSIDRIMGYAPDCVYLTHYSRVDDLERLAADLHTDLDAYVEMAIARRDAKDPATAIARDQLRYLSRRARSHGYGGDDATLYELLGMDARLNAQGLAVWLERRQRTDG